MGPGFAGRFGLVIGALLATAASCASTSPDPEQRLNAAFARIQVHEAGLERARLQLRSGAASCELGCAAAVDAQHEQSGLCAIAREVADADALARCERAQRTAASVRAQASRRCACR
jgi:hypothetical protein